MMKITNFFRCVTVMLAALMFVPQVEAQFSIGGRKIDAKKALSAAKDVAKAITLSDKDVAALCAESVEWMDANNKVDSAEYDQRLKRLVAGIDEVEGVKLNFKVYDVVDINAFACGDGSVRVFSSLMDIMNDDELMAIIGHEIGHVVHHDSKDAMKRAYMASGARNALSAAGGNIAKLSESVVGDITQSFMTAQFSQKQEYAADEFGFKFAVEHGHSPYSMAEALTRLVEISQGEKASRIAQMFSSHPDSEKRAARMRQMAEQYEQTHR